MEFEVSSVTDEKGLALAREIRRRVFIIEQNVPEEVEMDEYDEVARHILCLKGTDAVGTGRVHFTPEGAKVGRVAVLRQFRGKGVGTAIVNGLVDLARKQGANQIFANVQLEAVAFYEKLGFVAGGEHFYEGGIEHVRMYLKP